MRDVVTDAITFTLLVGLAFAPLERVLAERAEIRRSFAADLAFATLGQLFTRGVLFALLGIVLAALAPFARERALVSSFDEAHPHLARALEVMLGLVIFELMGYGYHRLAHRAPFLSRLHDVHHSAETLDWLASFRQHPLEIALVTLVQNVPLVLLGLPLGSHALVLLLLRLHTVFVHSNVHVPEGPWTHLVATPRFHHRHHDRDRPDANFATLCPLLDHLFGTHDAARAGRLGSPVPMPTGFWSLLLHPFRREDARVHDAMGTTTPTQTETLARPATR
jgi:sterol desaturase/sphingolipid hydroxylase (fatty acid hydroxylase superfamily)